MEVKEDLREAASSIGLFIFPYVLAAAGIILCLFYIEVYAALSAALAASILAFIRRRSLTERAFFIGIIVAAASISAFLMLLMKYNPTTPWISAAALICAATALIALPVARREYLDDRVTAALLFSLMLSFIGFYPAAALIYIFTVRGAPPKASLQRAPVSWEKIRDEG